MEETGKRKPTSFPGVYSRLGIQRKGKDKGKVDTVFDISYKKEGRKIWEKAGWKAEGYTAKLAAQIRAERLRMIRHGQDLPKEKARVPLFSDMARRYLEWAKESKYKDTDDKGFNKGVEDPRQRVVFHTLRHTFASWLAIQGTPILTIKELLGHKTLAMTGRYAHLIPDMKRRATLDLEAYFNQSRTEKKVVPISLEKEKSG